MELSTLGEIGLSIREARVYETLLGLGLTTVGPLVKKSGVPSSKIYETLDRLIKKGFVTLIVKDNRKHFQAASPEHLLFYLEERKEKMEKEIIPRLKLLHVNKTESEAMIYEGVRGIKAVYERMLIETNPGQEILVLGAPLKAQELLEPFFLNWNRRRVQKKIRLRIIYHNEAKQYGESRTEMILTKVKYLKKRELAPAWIDVFGGGIIIFDLSQDIPRGFLLRSKSVADNYHVIFESIWKMI